MRWTSLALILSTLAINASPSGEVPPARYFAKLLGQAKELELYSLDPAVKVEEGGFLGYKVLGKTTIKDAETLRGLSAAFMKGIEEIEKGGAAIEGNPRHGIRFVLNKTTIDLLLCSPTVVAYNGNKGTDFRIGPSPQLAFDKALKEAGVEVVKPANK